MTDLSKHGTLVMVSGSRWLYNTIIVQETREILVSVNTLLRLRFLLLHYIRCESLIVQVHGMKERLTQWVALTS